MESDSTPLPGTTLSPFDPTPSSSKFEGVTWESMESSDDGRQQALSMGPLHREGVDQLDAVAEANGGGAIGLFIGVLKQAETMGLLTADDVERLTALGSHMLAVAEGGGGDREEAFDNFQSLYDAIVDGTSAKPLALAIAAVAMDSVTHAAVTDVSDHMHGYAAAYGDMVGMSLGIAGGPLAATLVGVRVSVLTDHLLP